MGIPADGLTSRTNMLWTRTLDPGAWADASLALGYLCKHRWVRVSLLWLLHLQVDGSHPSTKACLEAQGGRAARCSRGRCTKLHSTPPDEE